MLSRFMEDGASSRFWRGAVRGLTAVLVAFVAVTAYARIAPPTPSLGSFLAALKLLSQLVLVGAG